jgi:hypothetical protein
MSSRGLNSFFTRYVLVSSAFVATALALVALFTNVEAIGFESLELGLERIERAYETLLGSATDESISLRSYNLKWFIQESFRNPFLGMGAQSTQWAIDQGLVSNISQNSWVQWGFEYGYLYLAFFVFVFFYTSFQVKRLSGRKKAGLSFTVLGGIYFFILLLSSFSFGNMFSVEAIAATTGLVVGLAIKESYA